MSTKYIFGNFKSLHDDLFAGRLAEDPNREPHEKETTFHIEGDSNRISVTSYRRVVFGKFLRHNTFDVETMTILDSSGNEASVSVHEFLQNPDLTGIGVTRKVPVGMGYLGPATVMRPS